MLSMCDIIIDNRIGAYYPGGTLMEIIEQIKAISKEGADLSGIESALTGLNPLTSIKDKDAAWGFIKSNDILRSTLDQKVTERVKTAEGNIMNGKFQEAMKAREAEIRAEVNPEETDAQKLAREFKEYKAGVEREKSDIKLKDELSRKAEEIKFSPSLAKELSALGEKADPIMDSFMEWHKAELDSALDGKASEQYGKVEAPKAKAVLPKNIDQKILEARKAGNGPLALRLQMQKDSQ